MYSLIMLKNRNILQIEVFAKVIQELHLINYLNFVKLVLTFS